MKKMAQATADLAAERAKHAEQVAALNAEKESITKQFDANKAPSIKNSVVKLL